MELLTPYPTMNEGFNVIPNTSNAKLLIRHSYRPTLKGVKNPDIIGLTEEGIEEANKFGNSLTFPIGACFSSPVHRCMQTIRALSGLSLNKIIISEVLGYSFIDNWSLAERFFSNMNLKQLVFLMSHQHKVDGFITIEDGVRNILNLLFSAGNNPGYLDLFCTHDLHLAIMDSFIFSNYSNIEIIRENWPNMLEGMWLWGNRNNFYIVWRGAIKHCTNFLI